MGKMSDQHIEKQEELSQEELEQQDLDEQQQAIAELKNEENNMTKENILNTLQKAIEYADRATDSAHEAEIQASETHTQAIEASETIEKAIEWLKEK